MAFLVQVAQNTLQSTEAISERSVRVVAHMVVAHILKGSAHLRAELQQAVVEHRHEEREPSPNPKQPEPKPEPEYNPKPNLKPKPKLAPNSKAPARRARAGRGEAPAR